MTQALVAKDDHHSPRGKAATPSSRSGRPDRATMGLQDILGNRRVQQSLSRVGNRPIAVAGRGKAKLTVGTPGDIFEQEADRISGAVMRMPDPHRQIPCTCGGRCAECQAKAPGQERLQASRVPFEGAAKTTAWPMVDEVLVTPGLPLDSETRGFMESRFGQDFSQVRVHTDSLPAESAKLLAASAYTVGRHIVFAAGEYTPHSESGRRLLAHELVHTLQQDGGAVRLQRATGPAPAGGAAGGCAEDDAVDEDNPASWAGILAHMQIQRHFRSLDYQVDIPRATKDNMSPGCPAAGTPYGFVDLWHYDGVASVQIGEIKSINSASKAPGEVIHYGTRFMQLVQRLTGGACYEDVGDPRDVQFDAEWLNSDLIHDRTRPRPVPLHSVVPATDTTIGPFWGDPFGKELRCRLLGGGAVAYWCNRTRKRDEDLIENAWRAADLASRLYDLTQDAAEDSAVAPEADAFAAGGETVAAESLADVGAAAAPTAVASTEVAAPVAAGGGAGAGVGAGAVFGLAAGVVAVGAGLFYVLEHAGDIVTGAVAAGLGEFYAAMDAAVRKIELSYDGTLEAQEKAQDVIYTLGDLVGANSRLVGFLRPLHEGVYQAWSAVGNAAREMQAIADRIKPQDLPTTDFEDIKLLMRNGAYPPLDSPDLATIAMFMLDAANMLVKLIRRLHAERESIIEDQAQYELKRD